MLTMLLYVLIVGLVAALLFLIASAVFGRAEELGPLPEGTTETVLPVEDISGADVRDLRFQQVFRGYKAGEVDWALARLAARIDELEGQLARARDESPQHTPAAPAVEQTGSGPLPGPWTSGTTPSVEQSATPRYVPGADRAGHTAQHGASGEERTVRTERQSPSGEERTVRTERHGGPPQVAGNGGAQATAPGFAPAAQTGAIPWPGPAATGPWEAPPVAGNGFVPAQPVPEPQSGAWMAGLVPEVSHTEQTAPATELTGSAELTGRLTLPPIAPAPGHAAPGSSAPGQL